MAKVTVKIENAYDDGHESEREVEIEFDTSVYAVTSEDDIEEWFNDVVFDFTGDGHGIDGKGSWYGATVVAAPDDLAALVGEEYEYC